MGGLLEYVEYVDNLDDVDKVIKMFKMFILFLQAPEVSQLFQDVQHNPPHHQCYPLPSSN